MSKVEGVYSKVDAFGIVSDAVSSCDQSIYSNRPFYRYGGHIEFIRFKEYYRMPRGHKHISFVFPRAFRDIFSYCFLRIRL